MESLEDRKVHSLSALCAIARDDSTELREWALEALHGYTGEALRAVALENLTHESERVRAASIRALSSCELDDGLIAALREVGAKDHSAVARSALARLIAHDDAATLDGVIARLAEGEWLGEEVGIEVASRRPGAVRDAMREAMRRGPSVAERDGWINTFGFVVTVDDLPWLLACDEDLGTRPARRLAVARCAWVSGFYGLDDKAREWTHRLDQLRALDDASVETLDPTAQRQRRAAQVFLSPDAWRKALSAARSRQWWHVIEEASLVWGRFAPDPASPCSPFFIPAFELISRMSAPTEHDAHLALALALSAVRMALFGRVDFATDPLPRLARWMLSGGIDRLADEVLLFAARWHELPADDPARGAVASLVRSSLLTEPSAHANSAQTLLVGLPDIPLDADTVRAIPLVEQHRALLFSRVLVARPELTRAVEALGVGALRETTRTALLLSVIHHQTRWASDVLNHALEQPAGAELPVLLSAARAIGDPRALTAIARVAPVSSLSSATCALFLARVSEKVLDERELPARPLSDPLSVVARCNRCGALATHEVGGATVHPDPERCAREGWDGVVFHRVVRCECGAEDDYTLPSEQRFLILAGQTHDELGVDDVVRRGVCKVGDGTTARRRGAYLSAQAAWCEAHVADSQAWQRYGEALRDAGRADEAVAAWRRSMVASADNLSVIVVLYQHLSESGDKAGADALVPAALDAWPRVHQALEGPSQSAGWLYDALKEIQSRVPVPVTLVAEFVAREGLVPPPVARGGIDINALDEKRPLVAMLCDPRVAKVTTHNGPVDGLDPLMPHIDAGLLGPKPARVASRPTASAEGARLGRNDPCHCGSGLKFKKCHGR